jgi:hypothetical protein
MCPPAEGAAIQSARTGITNDRETDGLAWTTAHNEKDATFGGLFQAAHQDTGESPT